MLQIFQKICDHLKFQTKIEKEKSCNNNYERLELIKKNLDKWQISKKKPVMFQKQQRPKIPNDNLKMYAYYHKKFGNFFENYY